MSTISCYQGSALDLKYIIQVHIQSQVFTLCPICGWTYTLGQSKNQKYIFSSYLWSYLSLCVFSSFALVSCSTSMSLCRNHDPVSCCEPFMSEQFSFLSNCSTSERSMHLLMDKKNKQNKDNFISIAPFRKDALQPRDYKHSVVLHKQD